MKKKLTALLLTLVFVCALIPLTALAQHDTYVDCHHSACPGYCYVYDQPSSIYGKNLGRINNGTYVTVYSRSDGWCYISGYATNGRYIYGYVHYWALDDPGPDDYDPDYPEPDPQPDPDSDELLIDCHHSACPGYCYVYDKPDSMNGNNRGRLNNGTYVTNYPDSYASNNQGGWYYISGYNTQGRYIYGYIHSWSATPVY